MPTFALSAPNHGASIKSVMGLAGPLLLLLWAVVPAWAVAPATPPQLEPRSSTAYVTLLYSDNFLNGVRVLGQSLRETGTKRDMVVLLTGNISRSSSETLQRDGWLVRNVEAVANPGQWTQASRHKFPARFWAVYTKLLVFNLTDWERVVYLDADTVVTRNIDELYLCDGLCGVMRHSERLNTGVLVLEPSEDLFKSLMERVASTPSYTGGDQGFLNSYFSDFREAPFFDPSKGVRLSEASRGWTSTTGIKIGRLPTVYNADAGLFVVNSNRWTIPEDEIRVLHYTLAIFKPWDWWSSWIMRNVHIWQGLRSRLPPSSEGLLRGETRGQVLARRLALPLPLLAAAILIPKLAWSAGLASTQLLLRVRQRARGGLSGSRSSSGSLPVTPNGNAATSQLPLTLFDWGQGQALMAPMPAVLPPAAIAAGVVSVVAALCLSGYVIVPNQMRPVYGWVLAYEWTSLLFVILFSLFLRACYLWGQCPCWQGVGSRHQAGLECLKQLPTVQQRPWAQTQWLFLLILGGLGLIPWWADIARMEALGDRVVLTAVSGAITTLVCAQAFIELAASWYQCGRAEGRRAGIATGKYPQP